MYVFFVKRKQDLKMLPVMSALLLDAIVTIFKICLGNNGIIFLDIRMF